MYLVFTRLPGGVNAGDSGLCCCVPCPLNTINSLCVLNLRRRSRPESVSDYGVKPVEEEEEEAGGGAGGGGGEEEAGP